MVCSRNPHHLCPRRNLVFLSNCAGLAEAEGAGDLFIGVNALEYPVSGLPSRTSCGFEQLPGLRPRLEARAENITLHAPLQHMTKADMRGRPSG